MKRLVIHNHFAQDGLAERIAGAKSLYLRPGTPGEREAAANALKRMGVDPSSFVVEAPARTQSPPPSRPKPLRKAYKVILEYTWKTKSGPNKGRINTAYTPPKIVIADDEIAAEAFVRKMFKQQKFGMQEGKSPEFKAYSTTRVHESQDSAGRVMRDALPMNSTGKYASDWSRIMAELRTRKPSPINKLWNDPSNAPAAQVAATEQRIREWNREYNFANRMQKKALEEDNENFRK